MLAACAGPGPPLRELYRPTPWSPAQPPLIVIPGAFGSRLDSTIRGNELWPASTSKLLFSQYTDLAIEIDRDSLEAKADGVVPNGILAQGVGRDFYRDLLRTLEEAGGYQRRQAGAADEPSARTYYVFSYDWRRSNLDAVRGLHSLIEQLRIDHDNPNLEVDIVAHSNGGMIARYYGRYGTASPTDDRLAATFEGARTIRRLITLGTPNLGTIQAALAHIRGEEIGLQRVNQEVVATWGSVPQLFPHPALTWLLDHRGNRVARDLFDLDTWRELQWSVFDPLVRTRAITQRGGGRAAHAYFETLQRYFAHTLDEGRAFVAALARETSDDDVAPYVFGADCSPTLARLVIEAEKGRFVARERPSDITAPIEGKDYAQLMFEPGDLVVTRDSLLGRCSTSSGAPCTITNPLRIEHSVFLCEAHQDLTRNPSFQNNLLYTLLHA